MPFDPTIPLQTKAPSLDDSLKPISSILGIQSAVQNLQTGKLQQQQLSNQLQERDALGKIDWNSFKNPDGSFDAVSAGNAALKASPAYFGPALAKQFNDNAKDQVVIHQGLQNLNQSQRKDVYSALGALAMDPDLSTTKLLDTAAQLSQTNPSVAPILFTALKHAPTDPKELKQWLITSRNSVLEPSQQTTNTSAINTGMDTQLVQTSPYQPGATVAGSLKNTVSPTQQETIETDALGNRYIVQRGARGEILNTRPVPGSYNVGAGGSPSAGPANLPPGGPEAIKSVQSEIDNVRSSANQAPVLHDLNRSIIAEAKKGFATGKLGTFTQNLASLRGYKFSTEDATDYNVLGKMLERSALQAAQGMGPQTNAGLEAQVRANGSLDYTPQAIKKIAQINDAIVTGTEHYRSGLEAAITASGGNPMIKRQFDQDWAKNFDPRIMRLMNATSSGDKAAVAEIMQEVGGPNSNGAKDLIRKTKNLQQLSTQGHL